MYHRICNKDGKILYFHLHLNLLFSYVSKALFQYIIYFHLIMQFTFLNKSHINIYYDYPLNVSLIK